MSFRTFFDYAAFISYRRNDGSKLARWLRRRLESYRIPAEAIAMSKSDQRLHDQLQRIYLDSAYEKPSDDFLVQKLFPALSKSRDLIVVSTPSVEEETIDDDGDPTQNWVVREIEYFQDHCQAVDQDRDIFLILGPGASDRAFPGPLADNRYRDFVDLRTFSTWRAILRSAKLDAGLAKLVAGIYRLPEAALPFLLSEERQRRNRLWTGVGSMAALVAGIVIYLWVSLVAEQTAREAVEYQRAFLTARQAIDNGAVDQGVQILHGLLKNQEATAQDVVSVYRAWMARLMPIEEVLSRMQGDGFVRWRGRNYHIRSGALRTSFDGPGVLLGGLSSDGRAMITLDADRVIRIRKYDALAQPLAEFATVNLEPDSIGELFDGRLFVLKGEGFSLSSDEDSMHAQELFGNMIVLIDRNGQTAVALDDPKIDFDCKTLLVAGNMEANMGLSAAEHWANVVVAITTAGLNDGLKWTIEEDANILSDRDGWSIREECTELPLATTTSDDLLSVRYIEFPKLSPESEFWSNIATIKDDTLLFDVDTCDAKDASICYRDPCGETDYRAQHGDICSVLNAFEWAEWLDENSGAIAFTEITGNQSAAVAMCHLDEEKLLKNCKRTEITARTSRRDFPSEGLVAFNSLEIRAGTLEIYRLSDMSKVSLIPEPKEQLADIAVADDGKTIALLNYQGEVWLYALGENGIARPTAIMALQALSEAPRESTFSLETLKRSTVFDNLSYAGDGTWVVSGGEGGIFLIAPDQNAVIWSRPAPAVLTENRLDAAVDQDRRIIYAVGDRGVQAFSLDNGAPLSRTMRVQDLTDLLVKIGKFKLLDSEKSVWLAPHDQGQSAPGVSVVYDNKRYVIALSRPGSSIPDDISTRTGLSESGVIDLLEIR